MRTTRRLPRMRARPESEIGWSQSPPLRKGRVPRFSSLRVPEIVTEEARKKLRRLEVHRMADFRKHFEPASGKPPRHLVDVVARNPVIDLAVEHEMLARHLRHLRGERT